MEKHKKYPFSHNQNEKYTSSFYVLPLWDTTTCVKPGDLAHSPGTVHAPSDRRMKMWRCVSSNLNKYLTSFHKRKWNKMMWKTSDWAQSMVTSAYKAVLHTPPQSAVQSCPHCCQPRKILPLSWEPPRILSQLVKCFLTYLVLVKRSHWPLHPEDNAASYELNTATLKKNRT